VSTKRLSFVVVAVIFAHVGSICSAAPVYFLLTELSARAVHHDSYVVPIENPTDIAHARDLIHRGVDAGQTIIAAEIATAPMELIGDLGAVITALRARALSREPAKFNNISRPLRGMAGESLVDSRSDPRWMMIHLCCGNT